MLPKLRFALLLGAAVTGLIENFGRLTIRRPPG